MKRRAQWEATYCAYFAAKEKPFMRTAYTILGSWSSAEDATQNTFVALYAHWPRIRSDSLDAYARRVLVNNCMASFRATRNEVTTEQVPERAQPETHSERLDLRSALMLLSAKDRAVLALRFLDDLPVDEVAGILKLPSGTIKSQTSRALVRLRTMLDEAAQPSLNMPDRLKDER